MKKNAILLLATLVLMGCRGSSVDEYVDFLYDNLSLPDRVDYPREYYVEQARLAIEARQQMPWGRSVPEREFRHFVLPPRVSNEDLDTCRAVFFRELKPRLAGLSMQEAILEVNHWCHEHVTYRPTNARTLSPLATMRTAYGRCGEESVFTVAALRSVGIPARQVYTPRWAHTDDNHAWVEAWADGRWWFLGACEPEPALNMGWFNESASRGMLMHTKVFGAYDGPEELVNQQYALTEINVIDNYAPTRRLTVTVVDSTGRPVPDASVEFKLYNYAEFYTVARKRTNAEGQASLTAGRGDMFVWASTPTAIAYKEAHFATDSLITLQLSTLAPCDTSRLKNLLCSIDIDVTPPPVSRTLPTVSPEQRAENDRRLAREDSIRQAYEATMPDQRSRGNHATIAAFRDSAAVRDQAYFAEQLLAILPDKDLQDVTLDVLMDNLPPSSGEGHHDLALTDIGCAYLLSPRIERERLTTYKAPLRAALLPSLTKFPSPTGEGLGVRPGSVEKLISSLLAWTRDSIQIIADQNPQRLRMQPLGVYRSRTADRLGRDIFFVAACRALGIPARINEINGKVQYFSDTWTDVHFDESPRPTPAAAEAATDELPQPHNAEGRLLLTYVPAPHLPDAKYYTHFTLSQLDEQNQLQLLTYPEEATYANTFRNGVQLDAGTYVLTTGVRLADGSVRAHLQTLCILPDETTTAALVLRPTTDAVAVIGFLNAENLYQPLSPGALAVPSSNSSSPNQEPSTKNPAPTSLLATCGRGYYALGLIAPNQEPTNHALRDIALVRQHFEQWGRRLVLLFENQDAASRFNFAEFTGDAAPALLPSTVVWGTDIDAIIRQELVAQLHLPTPSLPIFVICDSFNRVVFVQQGYTIGLGEQLLKVIQEIEE